MSSDPGDGEETAGRTRPRPSRRDARLERLVSEVVERVDEANRPRRDDRPGGEPAADEFGAHFAACDELVDRTRAPEVPAPGRPMERQLEREPAGEREAAASPSLWRRLLRWGFRRS